MVRKELWLGKATKVLQIDSVVAWNVFFDDSVGRSAVNISLVNWPTWGTEAHVLQDALCMLARQFQSPDLNSLVT